jgi:hypothetical protein
MCDATKIRAAAKRAHDTAHFYQVFANDCAFNYRWQEEADSLVLVATFKSESQRLNALAERLDKLACSHVDVRRAA